MARRKLLLVSYHFPPSAAVAVYRMLGFARHLPQHGWDVCVVAPPRMPDEPFDPALAGLVPPETAVYPAPFPQQKWGRRCRLLLGNSVWLPAALAACGAAVERERPDAVLTTSPPHTVHAFGLLLKHRF